MMNDQTSIMAMESHDIRPDEIPDSSNSKKSSKKKKNKEKKKSSSSTGGGNDDCGDDASEGMGTGVPSPSSLPSKKKSGKSSSTSKSKKILANEESSSQNNIDESTSEGSSNDNNDTTTTTTLSQKSKKKGNNQKDESSSNDCDRIIQLVTGDIWATGEVAITALEALCELLQVDDTRDYQKNRQLALRLGAHLPVVRKMKDFPRDETLQSVCLQLIRCWGNMPVAPWYELITVGALQCAVQIILVGGNDDEDEDESTTTSSSYSPALQDSALCLLEQMSIDEISIRFLVDQKGIDALVYIFRTVTDPAARERALGCLRAMMQHGGPVGRKAVAEKTNHMLLTLSDADMLKNLLELTAEMTATEDTAGPAIDGNIIEGLAHIFRQPAAVGGGGELRTKSLEILKSFVSTGGSVGRTAIVERTNWILQNSDDSKLLVPTVELCGEMVAREDTAQEYVQSNGVEGLSYAYKMFLEDKPIVPKYAHEVLLTVANTGGSAGRRAIIEGGVLEATVEQMQNKPNDAKVQLRGCQMVLALASDQRRAVKESGALPLISQIFSVHRKEKQTLKVAHLAMDAMVK